MLVNVNGGLVKLQGIIEIEQLYVVRIICIKQLLMVDRMGMILKYNFIGIVKYFFKNKILYVIDI